MWVNTLMFATPTLGQVLRQHWELAATLLRQLAPFLWKDGGRKFVGGHLQNRGELVVGAAHACMHQTNEPTVALEWGGGNCARSKENISKRGRKSLRHRVRRAGEPNAQEVKPRSPSLLVV